MTYYMQMKPYFAETVTHYKEDFLIHDRAWFRNNKGKSFLWAIRPTGTDILNLEGWDEGWPPINPVNESSSLGENRIVTAKEEQKEFARTWMTTYNKRWFHGHNGVVEEISKDRAIEIVTAL